MKNKLLLILPPHRTDLNSFYKPSWSIVRIPPIGLFAIKMYLEGKGHIVDILDCRRAIFESKTNDFVKLVIEKIKTTQPDVVGVNAITAIMPNAKIICDAVKENFPNIPVVFGSVHPSVEPNLTLQEIQSIDAVCVGAGEEVCLDIVNGLNWNSIPGLMLRDGTYTKREPERNLDKYPFPRWPEYYSQFSTHLTGWAFRGTYAMTSRSCPYSCKFCASDWSKPIRFHSAEYVIEMAKGLTQGYNVDGILFADDTIALNRTRIEKICEGFINRQIFYPYTNIRWVGSLRADQVDKDLLTLMKKAGCYHIGIGMESGSDRILKVIDKRTTTEMNRLAVKTANDIGLSLTLSFILGIPTETVEDMNQTINFMKEVRCNGIGVGTFRPLPGSPFYRVFEKTPYLRDWENLGNFSIPPKALFCDVSRNTFTKKCDEAFNLAYATQWTGVTEDVYAKNKELIHSIAKKASIRVCFGEDYRSINHKKLRIYSFNTILERTAISIYLKLPFIIRRQIKLFVEKLTRIKQLKWLLWRFYDTESQVGIDK